MTTTHTQGRLHAPGLAEIHDENNRVIACCVDVDPVDEAERPSPSLDEGDANARRLAACWNACEGVDTDLLEQNPAPFSAMRAELDALHAALNAYEAAHESLFTQCCSNPVTNAWGKQVDMTALNAAHEQAQRINTTTAWQPLKPELLNADIETLRAIMERENDWAGQGGAIGYRGDGKWSFVSTSIAVTPDELNALFHIAGIEPRAIVSRGTCADCEHSINGRERGYNEPCCSCARPIMSNFAPK